MQYIESLKTHRSAQLELLWNQWSQMGISGYGNATNTIADPEALLLYTLIVGRYDSRLYDEVIDWSIRHGELLSIPRIKTLLKVFPAHSQIGALAELFVAKEKNSKWKPMLSQGKGTSGTPLFFTANGSEIPVIGEPDPLFLRHGLIRSTWINRNHSQQFDPVNGANLMLKLRALIGVTARCEIIASLIDGSEKHPYEIAKEIFYASNTTQGTMVQMAQSGILTVRTRGREKLYHLDSSFAKFLTNGVDARFIPWAHLFEFSLQIQSLLERAAEVNLSESTFVVLFLKCIGSFENRLIDSGVPRKQLQVTTVNECLSLYEIVKTWILG